MTESNHAELIEHLRRNMALSSADAERLVTEVLSYFQEPPDAYIRRRHREMQLQGLSNAKIFAALKAELPTRVFPAVEFSERQIRRIVYG